MGEPALSEDGRRRRGSPSCRCRIFERAGRRDDAGRARPRVSGVGDADGDGVGRSARSGAGAARVSVRLRRRRRRWPTTQRVREEMRRRRRARGRRARWPRSWRAAPRLDRERFRAVGERGEGADRPEGQGAVSSDPRRADRARRRAGARSGGAGDRSRRRAAARRRHAADSRLPRARGGVRASAASASDCTSTSTLRVARSFVPRRASRMLIYGINPVLEALRAGRVTALRVGDRADERVADVVRLAERSGVPVRRVDAGELDRAGARRRAPGCRRRRARRGERRASRIWSPAPAARRSSSCSTASRIRTTSARSCGRSTRPAPTASSGSRGTRRRSTARRRRRRPARSRTCKIAEVVNIARALEELKEAGVWTVGLAGDAPKRVRSRSTSRCRRRSWSAPRGPGCGGWCGSGATGWCRSRCAGTFRA